MYYGQTNIREFRDLLTALGQLAIGTSVITIILYVWYSNQSTLDPSSLKKIEGQVIEKGEFTNRYGRQFRFRVVTDDGEKVFRVEKLPSSSCCIHLVPLQEQVTILSDWNWLDGLTVYQIFHNNKLVFNAIETSLDNEIKIRNAKTYSLYGFFIGGLLFGIRKLYDQIKKT